MTVSSAIELHGICKTFGDKVAVDRIDLKIPVGSFFGLVGPNGAGKTTALGMVSGLIRPDAGRTVVLGHDVWQDPPAAKALMGVLPDGARMFERLSGAELVEYAGRLRGMSREVARERSHDLLGALGLSEAANMLVADYSAGMKKKIGLASALVHAPKLLILDEPLEAVDPVSGEGIRRILQGVVKAGGTVVISSHVMEMIERLCDSVGVIANGQLLAAGPMRAVTRGMPLQQRFLELVGVNESHAQGLPWLQ